MATNNTNANKVRALFCSHLEFLNDFIKSRENYAKYPNLRKIPWECKICELTQNPVKFTAKYANLRKIPWELRKICELTQNPMRITAKYANLRKIPWELRKNRYNFSAKGCFPALPTTFANFWNFPAKFSSCRKKCRKSRENFRQNFSAAGSQFRQLKNP